MAENILTETDIRLFMKDTVEDNTLLDGVRFSSEDIEHAMDMVVDKFNMTLPHTYGYRASTFPFKTLLLNGVVGYLLRGASINEASNNLQYSADGVSINDKDKAQVFSSIGNQMWQEFQQDAQQIKITQNVAKVYGRNNSEYNRLRNV